MLQQRYPGDPATIHKLQCGIIWINLAVFPVYSNEYLSTTNRLLGKLKTRSKRRIVACVLICRSG